MWWISICRSFFDRIHHDRLIARLGQTIPDKRILRLVGLILRSGIMADGLVTPSTEGAVQGSPLSPLLSNIVLDELDKELERRGLEFCRFADDSNIFVTTPKAAERVMASIGGYIEKRLKLVVNREKSQVARSERVKFLGMTIVGDTIAISHKALQGAMAKVKELTPRGTHLTLEASIERINSWYAGWSSYFAMTYYPSQLKKIEAHIRRRLRSRLVDNKRVAAISSVSWSSVVYHVPRRQRRYSPTRAAGRFRTPSRCRGPTQWAGSSARWDRPSARTGSSRTGLMSIVGYAFREEPCTDPYARFCGQTGAAAPSDPIVRRGRAPGACGRWCARSRPAPRRPRAGCRCVARGWC
jgi:hypothetical protein